MRDFIPISISRDNNYDLIRLFAALQVVFLHAAHHMNVELFGPVRQLLLLFPGVPIFFFISGMLVTSSLMRSTSLKSYFTKRVKRVYPALWLFVLLSIFLLVVFGQITTQTLQQSFLWIWFACQATLVQFFNPEEFRDFGVGVVNGSLWTIPVEVSFYIALPILLAISKWSETPASRFKGLVFMAGVASFIIWIAGDILLDAESMPSKILTVSLLPHFWQFAVGVFAAIHYHTIKKFLENKVWIVLISYLIFGLAAKSFFSNMLVSAITAPFLYLTIFALGSNTREITKASLRGWDISYGLYLVHMLVVNAFIELGYIGTWGACFTAIGLSILLAAASWRFLEVKVLRRKPA